MRDANPIRTLGDYSKPSHKGYMNTIELSKGNNVVPLRSYIIRLVQNGCSFHGLRSEDPNQHLKDFLKLVDSLDLNEGSITTWEDLTTRFLAQFFPLGRTAKLHVPSASDHSLIELENQVQCLMEAYIALMQPTQVNKITSSYEICSGPHDTQYCMENLEQAFVDYASLRTDGTRSRQFAMNQGPRNFNEAADTWKGKPNFNWAHKRLSSLRTQLGQQQYDMISKINLLWKTISEKLNDTPIRNTAGIPTAQMNFKSTNDPTKEELRGKGIKSLSKLKPRRKPSNLGKICNFIGRVKGLKVFVGNFTYECDFVVLEDTTSVIDHDLGSVVLENPFVEATRKFLIKNEELILTVLGDGLGIKPDGVASLAM
ncbi:hypothetical protein Tco_1180448 [Tanacetum coccineum]